MEVAVGLSNHKLFRLVSLATIWSLVIIPLALCDCYYQNGTRIDGFGDLGKCGDQATCCNINRPNAPGQNASEGGPTRDECLPNGICLNRYTDSTGYHEEYQRNFCSNSDWSGCLDKCSSAGFSRMTPCNDTGTSEYWCCGKDKSCCNTNPISIPAKVGETQSTTSTTSSPTSGATATSQSENKGLSTGAKAGIGVGAALGALLIFTLGFFISKAMAWRRKSHAASNNARMGQDKLGEDSTTTGSSLSQQDTKPSPYVAGELAVVEPMQEMDSNGRTHELA